jgi:hypothetical protein
MPSIDRDSERSIEKFLSIMGGESWAAKIPELRDFQENQQVTVQIHMDSYCY